MCFITSSGYTINSNGEIVPGGPLCLYIPAGYRMDSAGNLEYIGPRFSDTTYSKALTWKQARLPKAV